MPSSPIIHAAEAAQHKEERMKKRTPQDSDLPVIEKSPLAALSPQEGQRTGTQPDAAPGSDEAAMAALRERRAERRKKKLRRRGIAIAGCVAAIAAIAGAVALLNKPAEPQDSTYTETVVRGDFVDEVSASGKLEPLSSTVISPGVEGTIAEVRVGAGAHVKKGDVLMVIKNDELDRAVTSAKADLDAAQAARKAAGETGEDGAVPDPSAVAEADRALQQARDALAAARDRAAARTVTSPIEGDVVAMNAQVGAAVGEGAAPGTDGAPRPLMQIADLSKMKVTVSVDEHQISRVKKDQEARFSFPAFPDLELTGRVSAIAAIANETGEFNSYDGSPQTGFTVDLMIDAPDPRLKPGMSAEATLVTQKMDDCIMVPTIALMDDLATKSYVNVETDAQTHESKRVDVTVVMKNDEMAVVGRPKDSEPREGQEVPASPLSEDDVLVVAGGSEELQ